MDLATGRELWHRARDGEVCQAIAGGAGPDLPLASAVVCLPRAGMQVPPAGRVTALVAATEEEVRSLAAEAELVDGLVLLIAVTPDVYGSGLGPGVGAGRLGLHGRGGPADGPHRGAGLVARAR